MSEKARENILGSAEIKSVLEFVTADEDETNKILELWPSDWPRTLEKSPTLVAITFTGSVTEVQERSIAFLEKLKVAGLPRPLKSSSNSHKGGGDTMDEDNYDDDDNEDAIE